MGMKVGVPVISSASGPVGNCVKATLFADERVRVENTKGVTFGMVSYTKDEWKAFVEGVKRGEFDIED